MEIVKYANEVIPPMTHPYGKAWEQPPLKEILIGEEDAAMSKSTFEKLHDYSLSTPTGVYEGKMWKARGFKERLTGLEPVIWLDDWYLHWWSESDDPTKCRGNVRRILIV